MTRRLNERERERERERESQKRNFKAQERRKKKNVQCMSMLRAKQKKNIMGKTQSNLIALTRYNQSHNPRTHEIEL